MRKTKAGFLAAAVLKGLVPFVLIVSAMALVPRTADAATITWGSADPYMTYKLWALGSYTGSRAGQSAISTWDSQGRWYGSINNPEPSIGPNGAYYVGTKLCLGADHPNLYGRNVGCADPAGNRNTLMSPAKSFARNWYVDIGFTINGASVYGYGTENKEEINFGVWVWADHDNLGCTSGGGGCINRIELMNWIGWLGYAFYGHPPFQLPLPPGFSALNYKDKDGDGVYDYAVQAYGVPPGFWGIQAGVYYTLSFKLNDHLPAEILAEPEHWKITWFGFWIEGSYSVGSATISKLYLYTDPDPAPANPTLTLSSGSTAVTASWTWPYSDKFYAYRLTLCSDSSCVSRITEWATTSPSVLDHTFSGLNPSTSYYIRMEVLDDVLNSATLPIQGIATKASTGGGGGGGGGRFI